MLDWEIPKQLQTFLGFATSTAKLIPNFAKVAVSLMDLKTKGKGEQVTLPGAALDWPPACDMAFPHLKTLFTSEPSLTHPDESQKFTVQVDTSDVGMGTVLLQQGEDSQLHPCAYFSKKFSDVERN